MFKRLIPVALLTSLLITMPTILSAAPAFVQGGSCNYNGALSCNFTLNGVTSGNAIILIAGYNQNATPTIGDTVNSYTDPGQQGSNWRSRVLYDCDVTGGDLTFTITFSFNTTGTFIANEVSGLVSTACLDQNGTYIDRTNPGTGTDGVVSNSIVTTSDGAFVMGFAEDYSTVTTTLPAAGTGFTTMTTGGVSITRPARSEYLVQSSAGSITATWTGANANSDYHTRVLSFHAAAEGGSTQCANLLLLGVGGGC